jgi:hypothetical protein
MSDEVVDKREEERCRDAMKRAFDLMRVMGVREMRPTEHEMIKAAYKAEGLGPNTLAVALSVSLANMGFEMVKLPDGRSAMARKHSHQFSKGF